MKHIALWTQESTYDETISILSKLALLHAAKGGKQGERITDYIISGDFLSVVNFSLDYNDGSSAYQLANCRQAVAFFGKLEPLRLGIDKEAVAKIEFKRTEELCRETNEVFRLRAEGRFNFTPFVDAVIRRAQLKIARVFGEPPKFCDIQFRHGPGATALTKKSRSTPSHKFGDQISCSEDLLPFAARLLEEMPHFAEIHESSGVYSRLSDMAECALVDLVILDDKVTFAPKDAKTYRTITTPSSLPMMVQLGIGDYMSDRLFAAGVNLRDQTLNQRLALYGSMSGFRATLDLKSASNTIATGVVNELFSAEWMATLGPCRSSYVNLDGARLAVEMFSSMGNGFTFPLESAIFWALTSSVDELLRTPGDDPGEMPRVSIFGDDIICPTHIVQPLLEVLRVFGFELNLKKSYFSGPFRESCGADYFRGIDIRPVYQKKILTPESLFRIHNYYVRDGNMEMADLVKDLINPYLIVYGPDGYGDGHLLGDWIPKRTRRMAQNGFGGVTFDTYKHVGVRNGSALRPGDRVLPTYSIYSQSNEVDMIPVPFYRLPGLNRMKRRWADKRREAYVREVPLAIPERVSPVDGRAIKCVSLPGTDGYKRVSIYTLSTGHGLGLHVPDFDTD